MLSKQVDLKQCYRLIPIAVIIQTANSFDCDIFMECENTKANVKSYDELKRGMSEQMRKQNLLFYFDGADEQDAKQHMDKLFQS